MVFDYAEQNGFLKILICWILKKMSMGGGLFALQFFGHLKRALELFISVRMSPLATFYDHLVDKMTPGKKNKKKQTNK